MTEKVEIYFNKLSQVTLFIILGIIILFVFGFISYIAKQQKQDDNIKVINDNNIKIERVKFLVNTCLDQATKEALLLAGMQGGFLYDYQVKGGYTYDGPSNPPPSGADLYGQKFLPFYSSESNGTIYNVSYAIKPRPNINLRPGIYSVKYPLSPQGSQGYPHGEFMVMTNPDIPFAYLPPLCRENGSNSRYLDGAKLSCPTYESINRKNISTQFYLENYILNKTFECINKAEFKSIDNMEVLFPDISDANISVLFGEDDVFSILEMEVNINILSNDLAESKFEYFLVSVPIRFKQAYELGFKLLEQESKNIFNNLKALENRVFPGYNPYLNGCLDFGINASREKKVNCFREGMNIKLISNACLYSSNISGISSLCNINGNRSSFIVIEDNLSTAINNRPFRFVMAIGNRPPVMDLMDHYSFSPNDEYSKYLKANYDLLSHNDTLPWTLYKNTITPVEGYKYDIVVDFNRPIYFIPRAIDPDEDKDYFNSSLMVYDGTETYSYSGWKKDVLMNSSAYTEGLAPQSLSAPVLKKDANYTPNRSEVGSHNVIITAYDSAYNTAKREVNVQVRCYDKLRSHSITLNNFDRPWVNLTYRYKNSSDVKSFYDSTGPLKIKGDYNYSNATHIDVNDYNDCCNESGGYINNPKGHKCDPCHRCNAYGECLINQTQGNLDNDCGPCMSCDQNGGCIINDSDNSGCNAPDQICCEGNCLNTTSDLMQLDDFSWGNDHLKNGSYLNQSYPDCWADTPSCIHPANISNNNRFGNMIGHYSYPPLDGASCTNCTGSCAYSCGSGDEEGRCT